MRRIRLYFCAVVLASAAATPALAGSWADCHRPPPAWYTAPRVTYTYSNEHGSGYSSRNSHTFSAQRRASPRRGAFGDPFRR